jgi:hypothetical protein
VCFNVHSDVHLCFTHWANSEVLLVLTQGSPHDGTAGVSKHVIKEPACRLCLFLSAPKVG